MTLHDRVADPPPYLLSDDRVEARVLRKYAPKARCAVIGSYKGATMRYLLEHGAKSVTGVEPQEWARDAAVANLLMLGPAAWQIDCIALVPWYADINTFTTLYEMGTDRASILHPISDVWPGDQVPAMNVLDWGRSHVGLGAFDFMVVNVEGAEYMLLPWLAMFARVMLVQMHGTPMPVLGTVTPYMEVDNIGKNWWLYQ